MPNPFHELRERLLHAGIAPRHVRRYLKELADHLADLRTEEESMGRSHTDAEAAAILRLGSTDELAKAMIEQRQFQSWTARAPWATFGLAPLLVLAAAWYVALFLLWSGWRIFLPGTDTPFIRIHGLAIIYFGVGRLIFFGAPIVVSWGLAIIAARQRYNALWLAAGLVLIACFGGAAQVRAHRAAVSGAIGHVSMGFTLAPPIEGRLFQALAILLLTALPYLIWRLQNARTLSA